MRLAPKLQTYMFNGLVQTPVPIAGMQFYGTAGGGGYRETLFETSARRTSAINIGGGVKMSLAGPLRLRFDYRVFTLKGDAAACEAAAVLRGDQSEVLTEGDGQRTKPHPAGAALSDREPANARGCLHPTDVGEVQLVDAGERRRRTS